MDWLGSDEVIHVGIGCKVLSLILEDDKVIGFGDSTFLFSCFVTFCAILALLYWKFQSCFAWSLC